VSAPSPGSRAAFAFIFVTVALDMLALGVMIPVLPELVKELSGGDLAAATEATGIFGFAWAAMQFFCSPIVGALSDRFGRRPIVLASNLGLGLDYVLMAMAPSLPWLFVGRVISGITSSSFSTASAYVADVTPPEERAGKFGMLGAAFGLGFVVGPAIGGVLGGIDLRLPLWTSAVLSLANALYGVFVLPESLPKEKRAAFEWKRANPIGALTLLRSHPVLLGLAVTIFIEQLAHESLQSVFVLYADYRYDWGATEVGVALAGIGICSTIVSALLVTPVVGRLGERRTMFMGLLLGATGLSVFALAPSGLWFLAGVPFISLWGLGGAAEQSIMSAQVEADAQGRLSGATASLIAMAGMIGPLIFTRIFSHVVRHPELAMPGAPYFVATALLCVAVSIAWRATRGVVSKPAASTAQSTG
jgi:DHA1 family tetracycline resistance protein-like MFS transporter